ncbi:MAG: ABC-2 transporter permease [Acetatifactor sp.]|nr:ABC-2 transporter permease [Acetatifactor sp.]
MWGLMLKDLYVNRRTIGIYSALAGACSVFLMIPFNAKTMEELGFFYTILGTLCLAGIFVLTGTLENELLLSDETAGYQQFVLSSPMGVKGQVLSKYYTCLLISLLGAFWCILLTEISAMVTGMESGLLLPVIVLFYLQIFLRAVELPFLFGLGARYGNYVKMCMGMVLVFSVMNHAMYGKNFRMQTFDSLMEYISGFSMEQLADGALLAWGLLLAGTLVLFYVSYYLSCLWYRRRMRQ